MPENGREITQLNGLWTLQQVGCSQQHPARVPGTIISDLLTAGQIPDPYYRDNESKVQWVGEKDWTLARTFHFPNPSFDGNGFSCAAKDSIPLPQSA